MPINHDVDVREISDKNFYSMDYEVMGCIFSIHREMGRFWNEEIYKNELAYRCLKSGFKNVRTEVPITISYIDFIKTFYCDLVIEDSIIYELKTVKVLNKEHRKQTLNYLFLLGLQRGKLINMKPVSVEYKFVSTRITKSQRYVFKITDSEWINLDTDTEWFKRLMSSLIHEWGVYLGVNIYYDALYHFKGGENNVIKGIEISNGSKYLGTQKIHLLNSEIAFHISAVAHGYLSYEKSINRFIQFTPLKAMQWINFNRDNITFKTITKK